MALLEKHLYTKKSKLPNAGKGLFTKVDIKKGQKIVEYKGVRAKWKEVKDDDGENGYIFYINRNVVIDAWKTKEALGRYANDALGATRVEGLRNNAEYIVDGKRCFIVARKNIEAGSEILVGYGADYWKTMKENWDLDKKKSKKKKKKKSGKGTKNTSKKRSTKKKSTRKSKKTTGSRRAKKRG